MDYCTASISRNERFDTVHSILSDDVPFRPGCEKYTSLLRPYGARMAKDSSSSGRPCEYTHMDVDVSSMAHGSNVVSADTLEVFLFEEGRNGALSREGFAVNGQTI